MLSNSCRYGIRALIYIASRQKDKGKTGLKQLAKDLDLPTPFMAKILQELAKKKILNSTKGPHGGFSLLRDPNKITMLEIVTIIDGDDLFTHCIVHNDNCNSVERKKDPCPLHDYYGHLRSGLLDLFTKTTLKDLANKTADTPSIVI
jgi:Rrf2 family protein